MRSVIRVLAWIWNSLVAAPFLILGSVFLVIGSLLVIGRGKQLRMVKHKEATQ